MLADLGRKAEEALKAAEEKWAKKLADTRAAAEAATQEARRRPHRQGQGPRRGRCSALGALLKTLDRGFREDDAARSGRSTTRTTASSPSGRTAGRAGTRPRQDPPGVRFGEFEVRPGKLQHGTPEDDRLKPVGPTDFALPAMLDFRGKGSLLIRTPARRAATRPSRSSRRSCSASSPRSRRPRPVHDHRPRRPRPELRRVHAPGRLRRGPHQPAGSGPRPTRSTSGSPT